MALRVSVSNLDLYRMWRDEEELDMGWLLSRLLGEVEQTPQMKAGEAFHKALETVSVNEYEELTANGYRFRLEADCVLDLAPARELFVSKRYGPLTVRGRVDAIDGLLVTDYKTTTQFDPDRLMCGFQWRYYLDMMQANRFRWEVFVLKETKEEKLFIVRDYHRLEQARYPELHKDCVRLAEEYTAFAREHLTPQKLLAFTLDQTTLEDQLRASIEAGKP